MIPVVPLAASPIQALQIMLRRILTEYRTRLVPDGIFGEETRGAVSEFQRRNGLPVTGAADQETWDVLVQIYRNALVVDGKAEPLQIVLQPGQTICSGESNVHLYLIQSLFVALDRFYRDVPQVRVNGRHDRQTAPAVVWLQKRAGLPESGEVDKHTWRYLARLYRLISGDGTGQYPVRIREHTEGKP